MIARWIGVIVLALPLAGCVTTAEREAALSARDDGQCQAYGAKPGTQAYFSCRMTKDQQRQAGRTQLQAAILARPDPQPQTVIVQPYPSYYGQPTHYLNTQSGLTGALDGVNRTIELSGARTAE